MKTLKTKAQKGFTLVEVIVVAVIVAAMAAVAVPMYLGYVSASRVNAAANAAGSIASFCGACTNLGGTLDPNSGAVVGTLTCNPVSAAGDTTTIQIPADITVNLVDSPRGVTAVHKDSDSTVTYNF